MARLSPHANSQPRWLFPFIVGVVAMLSVIPLARLIGAGAFSVIHGKALKLIVEPAVWTAVFNTFATSFLGMVISVALGGLFALALTLTDLRSKWLLSFLFMLPTMIPPQVTALAWLSMSGPSSPLLKTLSLAPPLGSPQPLYSVGGIALLLGVQHAPLVYLALRASLLALPRDGVEAAQIAGASPFRVLKDIILPLASPGLIAGAAIAFVSSVGNFGIPAILGIPGSIYTLTTLIYSRLASFGASTFGDIAILSALIALIAVIGLALQEQALKGRDYRIIGLSGAQAVFGLGRFRLPLEALLWLLLAIILLAPLAALISASMVPAFGVVLSAKTMTLKAYGEILFRQTATQMAFRNSLFLAGATAFGLLVIAILTAYQLTRSKSRWNGLLSAMIEIPYALPGIVISVSFVLVFAAPIPLVGVTIYGTIWIILFAYLSAFFAVGLKPILSAFRQLDPALEEAARLSGAGFWRRLITILVPLIAPAAGAAVILVFLIACNELTVSALLWSAGTQTLGVMIYNLDDSGSYSLASALSVLVVVMVVVLMLLLELMATRLPKGVVPWRN
ncbi:iron ABC transporter permease [Rhizobium sp.]|jgi:iron(III) transport system permease protein|uniref:ABC transporter permease n=1 Tax=Rhizobium sp. TaxID=391 RepID=UPI000E97738C|nr:ABC transporter permease [Rhizobium sp.]